MRERDKGSGHELAILCMVFPPLADIDRRAGTVLIVFAPTLAGWVPGAAAALPVNVLAKNPNAKG